MAKSIKDRLAEQDRDSATQKSYDTKDSGNFKDIYIDGMPFPVRKLKNGEFNSDIVPYFAGPNDPVRKEGEFAYMLDVNVHSNIGPRKDRYICPACFKKPCPACEERDRLREIDEPDEATEKKAKGLWASRRGLYFMIFYESPAEEKKGPQICEISHHLFEKLLVTQSKLAPKDVTKLGRRFVDFSNPTKLGKTINFTRTGANERLKFESLTFSDRDYDLPDPILQKCSEFPLDKLIYLAPYEEIKAAMDAGDPDDDSTGEESTNDIHEAPTTTEEKTEKKASKSKTKEITFKIPEDCENCFGIEYKEYDECGACTVNVQCNEKQNPPPAPEEKKEDPPAKGKSKTKKEEIPKFTIPEDCEACFGKEHGEYKECAECTVKIQCDAKQNPPAPPEEKQEETSKTKTKTKTASSEPAFKIPDDCETCFGKEFKEYQECGECSVKVECEKKQFGTAGAKTDKKKKSIPAYTEDDIPF